MPSHFLIPGQSGKGASPTPHQSTLRTQNSCIYRKKKTRKGESAIRVTQDTEESHKYRVVFYNPKSLFNTTSAASPALPSASDKPDLEIYHHEEHWRRGRRLTLARAGVSATGWRIFFGALPASVSSSLRRMTRERMRGRRRCREGGAEGDRMRRDS